jgi:hypothetical protein
LYDTHIRKIEDPIFCCYRDNFHWNWGYRGCSTNSAHHTIFATVGNVLEGGFTAPLQLSFAPQDSRWLYQELFGRPGNVTKNENLDFQPALGGISIHSTNSY